MPSHVAPDHRRPAPPLALRVVDGDAGAYALIEVRTRAPVVVPAHVLGRERLIVLVDAGDVDAAVDGERHRLRSGAMLDVPAGVPRRAVLSAGAALLLVVMPRGLERVARVLAADLDSDDRLAVLAAASVRVLPWAVADRRPGTGAG
jgi:hypothetical protein